MRKVLVMTTGDLNEACRQRDVVIQQRDGLLARIHRDGGHHTAAKGVSKSLADADEIVANLHSLADERDDKRCATGDLEAAQAELSRVVWERNALQAAISSWKWICEFCYTRVYLDKLPVSWAWVWQSAVCPDCQERVKLGGGYAVVKGGAYAEVPDPRLVLTR